MGQVIKLTNTAFLREHPFGNPIDSVSPVQTHSYIFPGDELLLYHKISLPTAAGVGSINSVKLVSAKLSLIAQKPNIFSEEFSRQFQATRNFELDSFVLSINNSNAPYVPWGSDGYASNLNFSEDRNWKLPSGDFRREIKMFTKHTASTSVWDYWFYFPVIFKWEYWIALAGADNDFFDLTQSQDGLNQWWYHYYVTGQWTIKSRLELSVLINGQPAILRSERELTPSTGDVNDYSTNTDWINKSIKTAKIGGTPSNTPAFIYGNQKTQVWAYFEKVSAWGGTEQGKITGVMWIEPLLGAGLSARTRGSSKYPATSETVFSALDTSITDDSGTGIQTAGGDYIVTSQNGNGVMTFFNPLTSPDAKKFSMLGIIDHNKLNAIYPGVTKFRVYARLYNSLLSGGQTSKGEEITLDVTLVSPEDRNSLCEQSRPQCPFTLDVFADRTDASYLKNDKKGFYEQGDATLASITFKLQKNNASCADGWEDKATISDNTYGSFFAFGKANDFSGDDFTDENEKRYTGLLLDWRKVLLAFGAGQYRMKIVRVDVFSNTTTEYDNHVFCLKEYHCNLIDRTVRIDIINVGMRGTLFNANTYIDYQGGWSDQFRLKGVLKLKGSSYVKEYTEYNDTNFNKRKPSINEQQPKYTLALRPLTGVMDYIVSTDILQADEMWITDYNRNNRHPNLIDVPLMNDADYTPRDNNLRNPLSDVEISLVYAQNNLRRRNS